MRGLARNFVSTHQTENPQGFSEVGENKQLLIAIVPVAQDLLNIQKFRIFNNARHKNISRKAIQSI
ncbi:hypothetical protein BWZ22_13300 [Seonamhaeicola sp. S2-3]|nr:hypothetical protein BWZ22_13300 [Seonamhaeicola sp. S2-3]